MVQSNAMSPNLSSAFIAFSLKVWDLVERRNEFAQWGAPNPASSSAARTVALLNFSASSACLVVTVALSWPASAGSFEERRHLAHALAEQLLDDARLVAVVPVPVERDRDTLKRLGGSIRRSSCAFRPMAFSTFSVSLPALAARSNPLNLVSAVPTVSNAVPLRAAASSSALRFSMLAPVASFCHSVRRRRRSSCARTA